MDEKPFLIAQSKMFGVGKMIPHNYWSDGSVTEEIVDVPKPIVLPLEYTTEW